MSARWMRELRGRVRRGEEPRPVGRPRLPESERRRVRALVVAQRERQGRTVGVPAIRAALQEAGVTASRMLVEQELAALKRADRAAQARERAASRVGHEIRVRDAVWGEDTTHLGRLEDGSKVEAEVVKDLGTRETVGLAVGGVPSASDVLALLERTAQERGGWPLVWTGDRASINRHAALRARLDQERVVHLLSRPHTPTDNAAVERQHRDLKEESDAGRGARWPSTDAARRRVEAARDVLDHGRRRATLGWRTAAEVGATVLRADALVDREAFHAAACAAMEDAARRRTTTRAVPKAHRDACFATLVAFGVATRHVGPRPRERLGPTPCSATRAEVECPGERP